MEVSFIHLDTIAVSITSVTRWYRVKNSIIAKAGAAVKEAGVNVARGQRIPSVVVAEDITVVRDHQPAELLARAGSSSCRAVFTTPSLRDPSARSKDMYALAHDWCGSQIAAPVNQAVKVLRAALVSSPEKVIHSSKSMTLVDLLERVARRMDVVAGRRGGREARSSILDV